MKQGFIKVATVTVDIRVADVWHNCKEICKRMQEVRRLGERSLFFRKLCLTGVYLQRFFTQDILLKRCAEHLQKLKKRPGIQKHLYLLDFHLQLMESFIMLRPH